MDEVVRETLEHAQRALFKGYALDLVTSALKGCAWDASDSDALFRTLVLDERWSVREAEDVYLAVRKLEN